MTAALSVVVKVDYPVTNLAILGDPDKWNMRTMFATAALRGSWRDDWLGVWDVMVHPDHRGEGHGRRVMQACIDYANERRHGLELHVRVANEVAIGLYESLGFTIERTNDDSAFTTASHFMVRPYQQETA